MNESGRVRRMIKRRGMCFDREGVADAIGEVESRL